MKNGVEYVRYDRINAWLKEWGFPHAVRKDDFILENMFYRLAMKASNETAQAFQAKVADEILPSIRRGGFYSVYKKEIDQMRMELLRMEYERSNLKRAREQLNAAVAEKQIEKAKLLRELALATEDNDLRNDLIRHAAKILIDEI